MPAYYVKGDDPSLTAQAALDLIAQLAGSESHALVVEEHAAGADLDVPAILGACATPPFLVPLRIVVVRDAGRIDRRGGELFVAYLQAPLDTTHLVLVAGGGTMDRKLVAEIERVGALVDATTPAARNREAWLSAQLRHGPVRLDAAAHGMLSEHLGTDLARLSGLLDTLADAYGQGALVGAGELAPFLGSAGNVVPWALTDAIDAGDVGTALDLLQRLLAGGEHDPTFVVGYLHRHFRQCLVLDGAGYANPTSAAQAIAAATGREPTAVAARQALARAQALGSAGIARAIGLLAGADLDVRGRTGWPPKLVLEVLVARLCQLSRRKRAARPAPKASRVRH